MRKIVIFMLIIFINPVYAFSNLIKDMEFDIGINGGQSNYFMKTTADSILKWRDINSLGLFTNIKYNYSSDLNFSFKTNYSKVSSGEMTDDDLDNGEFVYSRTKSMKGHQLKFDIDSSYTFYRKGNNNLSVLLGIRYQENYYKPKGIYQIGFLGVNNSIIERPIYLDNDEPTQYTRSIFYGPTLGISYERFSDNQNFIIAIKSFLASKSKSLQSNWGYNWSVEGDDYSSYGFDINISQGLKLTENLWINVFSTFEYLYGSNDLKEKGVYEDENYVVGNIKYLQNYKATLGISLKIK